MNACQARIPLGQRPRVVRGPSGFPVSEQRRCRQTVGTIGWSGLTGQRYAACTKPGHIDDVREQERHDENVVRARHDQQPTPRYAHGDR